MAVNNIPVTTAHERQLAGANLVDVRSTAEYNSGHPAGAVNVPLMEPDEDTGQMTSNPDFVRVMQANFEGSQPMMLTCQSGMRSARAAQMLEAFGFVDVSNVVGGFGGSRQPGGDKGWTDHELPVETQAPAGRTYTDLLNLANN